VSAQQRNIYAREWLSVYLYQENRYGKYNKSLGMGRGLQETTNLQEQYSARRASHFCFFFFLGGGEAKLKSLSYIPTQYRLTTWRQY